MEIGSCHRPIGATGCPRPLRAHRRTKNVLAFHFCGVTLRLPPAASRDRGSRGTSHERSLLTCLPSQERSTGPSHRRPGFRLSPSPAAIDTRCSARRYEPQHAAEFFTPPRTAPVTLLRGPLPSPRPVIGALHPREARACQYDVPGSRSRRRATNGCRTSTAQGVTPATQHSALTLSSSTVRSVCPRLDPGQQRRHRRGIQLRRRPSRHPRKRELYSCVRSSVTVSASARWMRSAPSSSALPVRNPDGEECASSVRRGGVGAAVTMRSERASC